MPLTLFISPAPEVNSSQAHLELLRDILSARPFFHQPAYLLNVLWEKFAASIFFRWQLWEVHSTYKNYIKNHLVENTMVLI